MDLEYYESDEIQPNHFFGLKAQRLVYHRKHIPLEKSDIDWGIEAVYIPINAERGLKLYPCIKNGRLAIQCQTEACGLDVGPAVLSPLCEFIFPMGIRNSYPILAERFPPGKAYGYYTQRASTCGAVKDEELDELRTKCMELLSFGCSDLSDRNVGYIGDRLVMIDFGWHTTGTPTQRPRGHFSITGTNRETQKTSLPDTDIIIDDNSDYKPCKRRLHIPSQGEVLSRGTKGRHKDPFWRYSH